MIFNYFKKYVSAPLRTFGALTETQLKSYASIMLDEPQETIDRLFDDMIYNDQIEVTAGITKMSPWISFDRKTLIAFWVFTHFAKEAQDKYFAAEYPSQLGFVTDEVYIISVCDNAKKDKELIALSEKKHNQNLKHIIVGANIELEDIADNMLPETDFIFASCRFRDLLKDVPEIEIYRVGAKEQK